MKRRSVVDRTIIRFRDKDKRRSGSLITTMARQMKNGVSSRIWRNFRRSVRKTALELKISCVSFRRIVSTGLGLSSIKRKRVHILTDKIRAKRLSRSKKLLTRFTNKRLEKVLSSEEKLFTLEESSYRQNETTVYLSLCHPWKA